jgi:amino acid transporter
MTFLLLSPFAVLAALGFWGEHAPSPPSPLRGAAPDLTGGVLVAMWNYMGWDNVSTVAGEVDRPQRTYPVAVFAAVALVALAYVIPFAAMAASGVDPSTWDTGAWADVARDRGGPALGILIVAGGMISAFGMHCALCLSYSRVPAVLAEDGYLPRAFARRLGRTGAPWVSVLACSAAWMLSLGLSFERLVCLDILLYGSSLVLEFVALVVLRVKEPNLPRPFRVPGGVAGAAALGVGPVVLLGFALVKNAHEQLGELNALAFGLLVMACGPLAYAGTRRLARASA